MDAFRFGEFLFDQPEREKENSTDQRRKDRERREPSGRQAFAGDGRRRSRGERIADAIQPVQRVLIVSDRFGQDHRRDRLRVKSKIRQKKRIVVEPIDQIVLPQMLSTWRMEKEQQGRETRVLPEENSR